jgi:hypothetical protein
MPMDEQQSFWPLFHLLSPKEQKELWAIKHMYSLCRNFATQDNEHIGEWNFRAQEEICKKMTCIVLCSSRK